eukprot:TRINITY_DN2774_c0_g1_i3.p2 TRINITY_DN2774_c0_g1~~TRINITY_DN2774_c0_g1_i3.p2  ORF type:complete len:201 (-),score=28.34 TRINITY_DN2774_c0_g1_i3:582-1184(-)
MSGIRGEASQGSTDQKENSSIQIGQTPEIAELSKIASTFNVASTRPAAFLKGGKQGGDIVYSSKENPENPRAKMIIRSRIEPKVFFANERTFLSWLNIAVLLTFTSFSLLALEYVTNADCDGMEIACRAGQIAGMIIAPLAFLMMAYAVYLYRKRTFQILRRDMVRIDDQCGPTVLTIMLIVVLTLAYVLVLIAQFTTSN